MSSSSTTTTPPGIPPSLIIPANKIRLDILLITGQRSYFDFAPSDCVLDVKKRIWTQWPDSWPARPVSLNALRLLHLGTFLDDGVILGSGDGSDGDDQPNSSTNAAPAPAQTSSTTTRPSAGPRTKSKKKADANSTLAANQDATAPRQIPQGKKTVVHLVVQGGFVDPANADSNRDSAIDEKGAAEDDVEDAGGDAGAGAAQGNTRNSNRAVKSSSRTRRNASGTDGENEAGGCCSCVIC